MACASYTLRQWLVGKVDFDFPDAAIDSVLFDRCRDGGEPAADVPVRDRELCLADLLMYAATSATASGSNLESDGGWQHQKAVRNVSDRDALRARAMRLYAKWGDAEAEEDASSGGINLRDLY